MSNYDFKQLSPSDFEVMARDILQAEMSITLESFVTGRDGGIDFRYAKNSELTVIQCKHYVRTGLSGLISNLKKEAAKVVSLNPKRYILVTSVALSPKNKEDIVQIIGNTFLNVSDILGQDDLNNLLTKHSDIEQKHYKLWLASRAVLDRVLNNAVITQSEFKAEQIYKEIPRYVQSSSYSKALKILDENRIVIIAGAPGVGKTTLANLLLYQHLEAGFQAVVIQSDIREAKSLIQKGVHQIFYFDDFFGATFLGESGLSFNNNEDQAFIDFISMVRTSTTSRLVLTTREHLMNQALQKSERLRLSEISDHKLILQISDYSLAERAKILYNHLYFSDLPTEYKHVLLHNDFYLDIVKHKKFNPRIIEWLSTYRRVKSVAVGEYRSFISNILNSPAEIWMHAYEYQISDAGRSMLLTIFSYEGKVNRDLLEQSFTACHKARSIKYSFPLKPNDFKAAFKELSGAFIKNESPEMVEVIDPSVLDLLSTVTRDTPENIIDLISGATDFRQIKNIWSFANSAASQIVLKKISGNVTCFSKALERVIYNSRKQLHSNGVSIYRGTSFEERLSILIDIADNLQNSMFLELIKKLHLRLQQEWQSEHVHIDEGIGILRAFDRVKWSAIDNLSAIFIDCRDVLIEEVSFGCSSDNLRDLISALDSSDLAEIEVMEALKKGYKKYLQDNFNHELQEFNSSSQYDGLISDLDEFQITLGINTDHEKEITLNARAEFEEKQSAYEEQMQDEWKEHYYDSRSDEKGIRELFGSLTLE